MADIKKIRFVDLTELNVYSVSESDGNLTIRFTGLNIADLIIAFKKSDNLVKIDYYVNDTLEKSYDKYTVFVSASEVPSGFVEIAGNIQTIVVRKKTLEERVEALEELGGL